MSPGKVGEHGSMIITQSTIEDYSSSVHWMCLALKINQMEINQLYMTSSKSSW